jgi:hypothetical protein
MAMIDPLEKASAIDRSIITDQYTINGSIVLHRI